jgi:16S rRNA (guanine(966)-N(2))-methyltransferase RsmD
MIGEIEGSRVLDLFAGSGALGLEALSRGALSAVFVESDRDAVRAIERNIDKLGLAGARIVRSDVTGFLVSATEPYDLVFVDPPYKLVESLRMPLAEHLPRLIADGGVVVFETAAEIEAELPLPMRNSRVHGSTRLTIFDAE